ncbi:MAG TPA: hypothetical protein EYQ31_00695, partial [Candidatus Handelsmanbacteria bacterium]|nr:hypothetical protein [Candidatus Handelsmanbacteria bacterium]
MTNSSSTSDTGPWSWLRGDLHTHCEDAAQIGDYVDRIDPRLDFLALTNHGQKPVFFEQHHMVAELRQRWTSGLVLSGVEWNAPGGGHACVVFSPHADEADHAYALARGFDRHLDGAPPDITAGMSQECAHLRANRGSIFMVWEEPWIRLVSRTEPWVRLMSRG